ncbi:zinc ribbon-containing protein [Algicola sagamiensis]|uniref:zinc ribbon-containing protein n=1 Tax=Algicola sagamiensis TaxID=163869 RepID=UPI00036866D6|nr:hypothetical protein [Algicola sagamiensis]
MAQQTVSFKETMRACFKSLMSFETSVYQETKHILSYVSEQWDDEVWMMKNDPESKELLKQEDDNAAYYHEWWLAEIENLADPYLREIYQLPIELEHQGIYSAGEWVHVGHYRCQNCGTITHIFHFQELKGCHRCEGRRFFRKNHQS